MIVNKKLAKNY